MKKLILIITLLLSENVLAEPVMKITPVNIIQGQHTTIEVEDEKEDKIFTLEFNKKQYKLFKKDKKNLLYLGFPADLKKGKYELILKENEKLITTKNINIIEKKVGSQNISYYKPKLSKDQENKIKEEDALVEEAKHTFSEVNYWNGSFIYPVKDPITGIYGIKRYLNGKYNNYHTGIDFASEYGEKIKATNNGKIVLAKYFSKYNSNGNLIYIDHGLGVGSVYLHLSKILVKEGDIVKKGQVIGLVGSSGRSTGPHLHWGVYLNGQNTDGTSWINYAK